MTRALSLYHRLPARARSVAATLRGMYLQHWRRGPRFERFLEEAIARETWSPERLRQWSEERLAFVLDRAATFVPYYRAHWDQRRRNGDNASSELLENWPVLEKETVRQNPTAFVADDRRIRGMFHEQTSGTTGTPLDVWRSRDTLTWLYAMAEARTLRWHGIPSEARYARLGGQMITPTAQRRPPFWAWNAAMRQLYMSTYHLAPDLIGHYLDALVRYRINYLAGYTTSITALAHEVLRLKRTDLRMLTVITNAEGVTPDQRSVIEEAFQCKLRETYGSTEMCAAASECPDGRLHVWPEAGHIEVWRDGAPAPAGAIGEFVCTGMLNPDMPLVRYRVGDRGRLAPPDERCVCGRTLPLLHGLEGRTNDVILTPDGRRVFWLNPVFNGQPIRQSQIVQDALGHLIVRIAPAAGFDESAVTRTISDRLAGRVGAMEVSFEIVDDIPRSANGKIQSVVCNLPADQTTFSHERPAIAGAPAA